MISMFEASEFKNLKTLEAFKPIIQEIEKEQAEQNKKTEQIKHGLVLLKAGLYWEGV